jgi:hypothetical protein
MTLLVDGSVLPLPLGEVRTTVQRFAYLRALKNSRSSVADRLSPTDE